MERIFDRVAAIPGVTHSGATMNRFTPGFAYLTLVEIENAPTADGSGHTVQFRRVSASYFATMRIRVRRGRVFDEQRFAVDAGRGGDQPVVRGSLLAWRRSDRPAREARHRV